MQERALLVGGHLTINPRIGGGTEVRLLVPIQAGA
jgi:signal transduction histidine kinase